MTRVDRESGAVETALLTAVSHEFRTPLAAVVGLAETLRKPGILSKPEARQVIERLIANAHKVEWLIRDFLDEDRLLRGSLVPARRPTDVAALIRRVVEAVGPQTHPVDVRARRVVALVDPALTERMVDNLLSNAVKHTPLGAEISIVVRRRGHDVEIRVEDRGPGVPDHLKKTIFKPFKRGPTAPAHAPGTGIGLALVAQLARLHGGDAWVEDRPGGGASFRVSLPAWRPRTGRPRVLIVDSETGLDQDLQDAGYEVGLCGGVGGPPVCARCPLIVGGKCALSDAADAFVFARDLGSVAAREILEAYRARYAGKPLIVTVRRGDPKAHRRLLAGCVLVPAPPPPGRIVALLGEMLAAG